MPAFRCRLSVDEMGDYYGWLLMVSDLCITWTDFRSAQDRDDFAAEIASIIGDNSIDSDYYAALVGIYTTGQEMDQEAVHILMWEDAYLQSHPDVNDALRSTGSSIFYHYRDGTP